VPVIPACRGAIIVGMADNKICPLVIMGRVKLHRLIPLFALIDGAQQFGYISLFIHPTVPCLVSAFVDMMQEQVSEAK
jgi:predicted PurR-regulated permease PerM